MSRFDALIFDIDGTLWDTREILARGYNKYLAREGYGHIHVDPALLLTVFGKTTEAIADAMFPDYPVPLRYDMILGCMDTGREEMLADPCRVEYPGVVETLEKLSKEYRLFVVSNSESGYPDLLLDKLGVRHLFEGYLCYGDTRTCKGETIRILMDRYRIGSAIYIGDTQGDLEACRMAGIPFIHCAYGFGDPVEYVAVVDQFPQLPDVLKNL